MVPKLNLFFNFIIASIIHGFFSILSKHVEHNKCPFFFQNVLVDLSISFLQIKHLNIGGMKQNYLLFYQNLDL